MSVQHRSLPSSSSSRRSGSAANTQAVSDIVRYYLDSHAMELGHAPLVKTAAALFQEIVISIGEINGIDHLRRVGCEEWRFCLRLAAGWCSRQTRLGLRRIGLVSHRCASACEL